MKVTDRHKTCPDCGVEFIGHYNTKRCKTCTPKAKKKLRDAFLKGWLSENRERINERYRERRATDPDYRKARSEIQRKCYHKDPEKHRAKAREAYRNMTKGQRDRMNERNRLRGQRPDVKEKNRKACRDRYYDDHEKTLADTRARFKIARENATPEQREAQRARHRAWSKTVNGRLKSNRTNQQRRALKLNAILYSTDKAQVNAIYKKCIEISERKGTPHNVDHIIPLSIGGAHHQDNLQIITASENFRKGDRYDPSLGGVWANNELAKKNRRQYE